LAKCYILFLIKLFSYTEWEANKGQMGQTKDRLRANKGQTMGKQDSWSVHALPLHLVGGHVTNFLPRGQQFHSVQSDN